MVVAGAAPADRRRSRLSGRRSGGHVREAAGESAESWQGPESAGSLESVRGGGRCPDLPSRAADIGGHLSALGPEHRLPGILPAGARCQLERVDRRVGAEREHQDHSRVLGHHALGQPGQAGRQAHLEGTAK